MRTKVIRIMSTVFQLDKNKIDDNCSMENIKLWDSLKHISLIILLEEEFNCEFSTDEVVQMISLKKILSILKNK